MSLEDQASLLLIPSGYKSQKVYSIFPTNGDGDFNFSRSGVATRIAKNGLITTVDSNVPRLEYPLIDGVQKGCPSLILEPQRTNLSTYSEDFSNAAWSKNNVSINTNNAVSPDGSLNASSIVGDGSTSYHWIQKDSGSGISGKTYSISFFAKKGSLNFLQLVLDSSVFGIMHQNFDLENGVIGSSSGSATPFIKNYGNGWYRLGVTATATSSNTIKPLIALANSNTIGRFGSFSTSGNIKIYGVQVEEGSYPTSYIKTNGGTVTRSAETATGSGDAATFNDSEGVLMVEMNRFKQTGVTDFLSFGIFDSSGNNAVAFKFRNSLNVFYASIESTLGSPRTDLNYTFDDLSSSTKILVKYKTNDFALWVNGFKVVTDSSGYVPTGLNQLKFANFSNSEPFYGKAKQIQYYNSALTDSELEQLTSWTSFTEMAQAQQYSII